MEDGTVLGDVDLFPTKHGMDPLLQARFCGQLNEEPEGFSCNTILRVIKVEPRGLGAHKLATLWIIREKLPEMHAPHFLIVGFQGLPRWPLVQR
jgi:hypothetical protein